MYNNGNNYSDDNINGNLQTIISSVISFSLYRCDPLPFQFTTNRWIQLRFHIWTSYHFARLSSNFKVSLSQVFTLPLPIIIFFLRLSSASFIPFSSISLFYVSLTLASITYSLYTLSSPSSHLLFNLSSTSHSVYNFKKIPYILSTPFSPFIATSTLHFTVCLLCKAPNQSHPLPLPQPTYVPTSSPGTYCTPCKDRWRGPGGVRKREDVL